MSVCISSHGEFGTHEFGTEGRDRFVCEWCGVFDEDALLDRLAAAEAAVKVITEEHNNEVRRRCSLEAAVERVRTLADEWDAVERTKPFAIADCADDLRDALEAL